MARWVEIKGSGVVGMVLQRVRRPDGPVLVIDVNGSDGIFYAEENEVRDVHAKLVPKDDLDTFVEERTKQNPNFPEMIAQAKGMIK